MRPDPLELLFIEDHAPDAILVLVQLPGAGSGRIVEALAASLERGRWRSLPSPPADSPPAVLRGWHRDAWMALSGEDRRTLALASGPTAAHLTPVLGAGCETVALVAEPFAALIANRPGGPPAARVLAEFENHPDAQRERRLVPWANPQSRALLGPWHDTQCLPVTLGPPDSAERWRELLFGDVLSRVKVSSNATAVAREVAGVLGLPPKRTVRAARTLDGEAVAEMRPRIRARRGDLLCALSWLDVELYERSSMTPASAGRPGAAESPPSGASSLPRPGTG